MEIEGGHGYGWEGQKRRKCQGQSLTPSCVARDETIGKEDEITRARSRATMPPCSATADDLRQTDMENYVVGEEEFHRCLAVLSTRSPPITIAGPRLDDEQQRKVYERLVLYRIRASKLAEGVSIDELDDMTLRKEYSPEALKEMCRLGDCHRVVDTFDWYFDRAYSVYSYLTDYQRLVLSNGEDGTRYLDWEKYHSWFNSYEMDEEYVKYFEEISMKIKWIKQYMECERGSPEWIEVEARGFQQAVKIAVDFPRISSYVAFTAYMEHIFNVQFDYSYREDIDRIIFEIWKRATGQINCRDAMRQVHQENMFPRHNMRMQFALDNNIYCTLQAAFDTCMEGIPDDALEDEARRSITWTVWNNLPRQKPKTLNQYIMRKIEVSKHIDLDLQASCLRF